MSVKLGLLALLDEQPSYGYQLHVAFKERTGETWPLNIGQVYTTLQRQQQRPDHERVRVALKVDEAHLVINESFADALATLRSAGLEVVAAWQYGEQIQDPKIRAGMLSVKVEPCPSRLSTSMWPPSNRASRWLIARPSPVPLWDRVALLSTW